MNLNKHRFLILLIFSSTCFSQTKIAGYFKDIKGTFVLSDTNSNIITVYNRERAAARFSPFSTYKIPNSIIALETGIIANSEQIIKWDPYKYPAEDWWPPLWIGDHNLKSAIKYSVVPFYRHVATQIGIEKMKKYVNDFNYGNKDISSGVDDFWLNGSLKISAFEQIEFLQKFFRGRLNISSKTLLTVKNILILESSENYILSAKTGGGYIDKEQTTSLGWFVGYIKNSESVYFFALNMEGKNFGEIQKPRIEITKHILRDLAIIP